MKVFVKTPTDNHDICRFSLNAPIQLPMYVRIQDGQQVFVNLNSKRMLHTMEDMDRIITSTGQYLKRMNARGVIVLVECDEDTDVVDMLTNHRFNLLSDDILDKYMLRGLDICTKIIAETWM